MTDILFRPAPQPTVGYGNVARSELTKLRTLRSTYICVGFIVVAMVGLAWLEGVRWHQILTDGFKGDRPDFDATLEVLNGVYLAQLVVGVLSVLAITSEYATGMIHATFSAVPQRRAVLAAKAAVVAGATLVLGEVLSFGSFLFGQALLGKYGVSLSDPGVLRAVVGAGLYLSAVSLLGLGIGAAIRHTAGGVSAFFGVLFAPTLVTALLPTDWRNAVINWLPANAGSQIFTVVHPHGALQPWAGLGVFCSYAVVAMAAAWVLVTARDA
jgi:ABC-2 type transport system permease protein